MTNVNYNKLIESTIWNNISNLESAMDSVLNLTLELAYEWNWSFDDAKKHLLSEADDILDTYVNDLREVDDELAGKVENCIKNIVEEVKPINNHDDFDWDEFKDYDIEDLTEEVKALIAKHDAEETTTEENANNGLIESTIWNNINDLNSSMYSVLCLTIVMTSGLDFDLDVVKEHLLSDADDILNTYVEGLREVDEELAQKVEFIINNIVDEVKPINNHDDFDWDDFNDFGIKDVLGEVYALITKHDEENK